MNRFKRYIAFVCAGGFFAFAPSSYAQNQANLQRLRLNIAGIQKQARVSFTPQKQNQANANHRQFLRRMGFGLARTTLSGATPPLGFLPRSLPQCKMVQVRQGSYKKHIIPQWELSGLKDAAGNTRSLKVDLFAPVSGHVGGTLQAMQANADSYSKTNIHKIWLVTPKGQSTLLHNGPATGAHVTHLIRELSFGEKGTYKLYFDPLPGHTAGIGGFPSGRTVEIKYDGT